jgi:hypothetical protein
MLDVVSAPDAVAPADADPLGEALPLLRDTLVRIADEARHPMVVTDATGRVLWRDTRDPAGHRPNHRWTFAACAVHEPDAGVVIGAVDVSGPVRAVHPTTPALVAAAARLADSLLAAQQAVRDELLLTRHQALLDRPRGEPAALLARTGRVLASHPAGWLPARVTVPPEDDDQWVLDPLPDGWLLRLPSA